MRYLHDPIQNPIPPLCDMAAVLVVGFFALIVGLSGGLSTSADWAANWWPLLRIFLVSWAIFRGLDLLTGGPWRRRANKQYFRHLHRQRAYSMGYTDTNIRDYFKTLRKV